MTQPADPPLTGTPLAAPSLAGTLVVFDLDGTLVDTAPDLAAAANEVLVAFGRQPVPIESLRPFVGMGGRRTLQAGLEQTGAMVEEEVLLDLNRQFVEVYSGAIAKHSAPFPHAIESMDRMEAMGARFSICTNKRESLARQLLETLDLMPRFASLVGGDTCETRKPDAAPLIHTIETARAATGTALPRAVMIGDTAADTGAARAAGIPVIGVTFGYSPTPMPDLNPDAVIDSFAALPEAVLEVLGIAGTKEA